LDELGADPSLKLLSNVPHVEQEGAQDCGAAAMSAALRYWGVAVSPEAVRQSVEIPMNEPIAAGLLRDYAEQLGFHSFLIAGSFEDLKHELSHGRPVIVGTLKPYVGNKRFAHYEVVMGLSDTRVVTMDPATGYRQYPRDGFVAEWNGSKRLSLLMAPAARRSAPSVASTPVSAELHTP
jgi:ABC-type bacteriocin/lantibiotic exporter with double-glycine peptidase domain